MSAKIRRPAISVSKTNSPTVSEVSTLRVKSLSPQSLWICHRWKKVPKQNHPPHKKSGKDSMVLSRFETRWKPRTRMFTRYTELERFSKHCALVWFRMAARIDVFLAAPIVDAG